MSPDEFMMDYINWGGFPLRLSVTKESDIKRYLEQTYEGILDKDIITEAIIHLVSIYRMAQ